MDDYSVEIMCCKLVMSIYEVSLGRLDDEGIWRRPGLDGNEIIFKENRALERNKACWSLQIIFIAILDMGNKIRIDNLGGG
jgi:hypothetical protein